MREGSRVARRDVLALGATGLVGLSGLSGCLGGGGGAGSGGDGGTSTTADGASRSLAGHEAAVGLDAQPSLGPDPFEATATIVAFEDPSCPTCRRFEQNVVPRLQSDIDAGTLSFVARTYPVIYPWGKPAVQALEATYARDEDAFWGLYGHYFEEQGTFSTANVLDLTRTWLSANTDLDADAVVADAEAKRYDDAVQSDLDAGDAAGANGITPSLFLFRDGQYRTVVRGSAANYDVIAGTLEL